VTERKTPSVSPEKQFRAEIDLSIRPRNYRDSPRYSPGLGD
jgi:hypothetical protein